MQASTAEAELQRQITYLRLQHTACSSDFLTLHLSYCMNCFQQQIYPSKTPTSVSTCLSLPSPLDAFKTLKSVSGDKSHLSN